MRGENIAAFMMPKLALASLSLAVLGAFFLMARGHFLVFHILLEFSCIVVGVCGFAVIWTARNNVGNGFLLITGTTLLPVSILTFLHTLTYKGMAVLPGTDPNVPAQLWLASRLLLAGAMATGTFFLRIRPSPWATLAGTTVSGFILGFCILEVFFPQCFVEGKGPTQFNIWAEYLVPALFVLSAFNLWGKRSLFERDVLWIFLLACLLGVASELSFTMHVDPHGTMNMIGHILAFGLFVCLFRALVVVGIRKPQATILRELALKGRKLEESEALFSAAFKANPEAMVVVTLPRGLIEMVNEGFLALTGYSHDEVTGKTLEELGLWAESGERMTFLFTLGEKGHIRGENFTLRLRSGELRIGEVSGQRVEVGGKPQAIAIIRDVTSERVAQRILSSSKEKLEETLRERNLELSRANEALRAEIRRSQKIQEELRSSKEELKRLSASLLSTGERERKELAREIHDSLGQILAAAKFSIERALWDLSQNTGGKTASGILRDAVAMVQGAIEEVRRIQMDLRPAVLDDLGLVATLNWFCREFQKVYGKIEVEKRILLKEEEVPEGLKIVIFRVLQEAMNNVAKHSMADKVEVSLYMEGSELVLSVRDNGIGMRVSGGALDATSFGRGMGVVSMRERVELSGGKFTLKSDPGQGTHVEARWPLDPEILYDPET
jgi:PAS domain S-box-containing protein